MYVLVSILILIICILLILIVLVQNSKGGGLASNFQSSNQYMGVRQTTDFLEKSTWTLAIALLALSLISIFVIPRTQVTTTTSDELQQRVEQGVQPVTPPPAVPTQNPVKPQQ
jgi:preprotein translocase subunit SecG